MGLWTPNRTAIGLVMDIFGADVRALPMQDTIQPVSVYTDDSASSLEQGSSWALYSVTDAAQTASSASVIHIGPSPRAAFLNHLVVQSNVTPILFEGTVTVVGAAAVPPQFARGTPARVVTFGDVTDITRDALTPIVTLRPESTVGWRQLPTDIGNSGIFIPPDTAMTILSLSSNTSVLWTVGIRELTNPFVP